MNCGGYIRFLLVSIVFVSTTTAFGQSDGSTFLQDSVGKWKAEIKMWEGEGDPTTSTGSETSEMIGENWLVSRFEGDFGGMKFTGVGVTGFDGTKKKFVNHWVDSMSPAMSHFEGPYDNGTKSVTMLGEMEGTQGKHVTQIKDSKTRVFTMYQKPADAKDFVKIMEITYTKQ